MTPAVARQPGLAPVDRSVRERSIGERFLDVVGAHAGRPAVGALTYDELEQASRRLAAAIRERVGTAIGERVALLLGDPTQQVVAIFAALRAGQAFVPLDPSHPPARLRAILTDCEPRAIIAADLDAARSVAGETPCPVCSKELEAVMKAEELTKDANMQAPWLVARQTIAKVSGGAGD